MYSLVCSLSRLSLCPLSTRACPSVPLSLNSFSSSTSLESGPSHRIALSLQLQVAAACPYVAAACPWIDGIPSKLTCRAGSSEIVLWWNGIEC